MIRQAISCDVCGTEKRQTNHWFVAFEQAGELRLGGWTSRNRARPGSKHLCGQTCVHKLVDEYMAQIVASKPVRAAEDGTDDSIELMATSAQDSARAALKLPSESMRATARANDRSLAAEYDFDLDQESSARLITTPEPAPAATRLRSTTEAAHILPHATPQNRPTLVAAKNQGERSLIELPLVDEAPSFSSRKWRSEAWERERERELRATANHPTLASRLRLN